MKKIIFLNLLVLVFMSCSNNENKTSEKQSEEKIIGKPNLKLTSDIMTPEVLWSFGRLSDVQVSPDEKKLLFGVSYYDIPEDKGNRELYTMSIDGNNMKQITKTAKGEYNAVWSNDGKSIYFMSSSDDGMQVFKMNEDGSKVKQISTIKGGISGFKLSPNQSKILYTKEVNLVKTIQDKYADLPKANARIINDMMYRHWDVWADTYSHVFVADFDGNSFSEGIDIMKDEEFDSPLKPFGGLEEIAWSNDSKIIAYTCVKKKGLAYTLSTNSDIYLYDIESKQTKNLTQGMNGYDKAPAFSPDGNKVAWESMERDGYESDKITHFV
jgi:Tol biopolymer transport system component